MIPWERAVAKGQYKRFVAVTGAQIGKTDSILDIMGSRLDQRPVPIIYVGPNKEFLTDQFEPRLMALLDEAKSLKDKVIRGRRMKKTLKWVAGVRVRLAHAGSSTALKSDPAALAFIDEYDEMSKNIKGQGDALGLVEARGDTYADFAAAITSTPSNGIVETEIDPASGLEFWSVGEPDEIQSPIWRLWQEGTRYHWAWPCKHCGEYFIPRFKCLQYRENATPAEAGRSTVMVCPRCGGIHTYENDRKRMNDSGVYVAPGQQVSKDGQVTGIIPDSTTFSVWISGLVSPFVSWGTRIEKYLTAINSGDQARIQTALNAGFGQLYTLTASGDIPEWQEIMQRRLPYKRRDVPEGVLRVVMGVDVQKFSLIYSIHGFGSRGTSWLLDWGQLYGATDDDEVWGALADLMIQPIGGLTIEKVFVDSGFRPNKAEAGDEHKVYEFARRWSWLISPTKGRDTMPTPYRVSKIEVKPSGKKAIYSINLVLLHTDFFKSLLISRIRTPIDEAGAFFVPEDIDEDYCRQVVSEARIVDRETGKPQWVRRNRLNHFMDTTAMAMAAAYTLNVQRIPEGVVRAAQAENGVAPVEAAPPSSLPPVAVPNLRTRFANLSATLNR